jgi:hypothetical protein
MLSITQYEQTAVYDPTDPTQVIREVYTPGGYSSFYFNRVAPTVQLKGLGAGWADIPSWAQIAIVAAGAIGVGYFGMAKLGDRFIKPGLRKVGINLTGARFRRRR